MKKFIQNIREGGDIGQESFKTPDNLSGFIVLSEYGCGEYRILIVTGEMAGSIWCFHSDGWLYPYFKINAENEFELYSFYDWYKNWLDESLQLVNNL